jgi:hypothetical protein
MPLREVNPAGTVLWRVGRYPDPLAWTPWPFVGGGRFGDPRGVFRVLYLAEQRLACFLETLARFRVDLPLLAELAELGPGEVGDDVPRLGSIAGDWLATRRIGWLQPLPDLRVLDLRALETRETLRGEPAGFLAHRGYRDLDLGELLRQDRVLTQHVSRWAHDQGYRGMVYPSRFGAALACWALHGGEAAATGNPFIPLGTAPIAPDDPDLWEAVRLFGLAF